MSWLCAWCQRLFSHLIGHLTPSPPLTSTSRSRHTTHVNSVHHPSSFSTSSSASPSSTSSTCSLSSPSPTAQLCSTSDGKPPLHLLSLPDDLLLEIMRHLTHCQHDSASYPSQQVVEARSYASACALTAVSKRTADLFYASLDNVSLASSAVTDHVIESLARRAGPVLKRLVLRGSVNVTNATLHALAQHSSQLRSLDLSFLRAVDGHGLAPLCAMAGSRLRHLLLRKCARIDDSALQAIAACYNLHTLDISYCSRITDVGMDYLVTYSGHSLRLFAMAYDTALTDKSFVAIGRYCKSLVQLCARGLPFVTNAGFAQLCTGIGNSVEGIDVTLCCSLTRDATLRTLGLYCQRIYVHIMPKFASRPLRQIIISTLRQNIFIVHGSDPESGKDTVHTVLIDNGDLVSASLLSSGTTDLSMLGIVLCKSYGSTLNEETKQMLEDDYGIPTSALTD